MDPRTRKEQLKPSAPSVLYHFKTMLRNRSLVAGGYQDSCVFGRNRIIEGVALVRPFRRCPFHFAFTDRTRSSEESLCSRRE